MTNSHLQLYPGGHVDRLMALSSPQALADLAIPAALLAQLPDPLEEPGAIDPTTVVGPVAVIDIRGVLSKWASWWRWFGIGSATLPEIESAIRKADADPRIETILLRVSSPGGTVPGIESCGDAIFEARGNNRVVTFAEDLAASAGYWLGCQAEEFVTHNTGEIGSIGVFTAILDAAKWFEAGGLSVFLASSGGVKGQGTFGVPLSDEFKLHMGDLIEAYGQLFDGAVARGRGVDLAAARKLRDGRTHLAAGALDLGLIDRIQSFDSLLSGLTGEDTIQVPVPATDPDDDQDEEQATKEGHMGNPKEVEKNTPSPKAEGVDEVRALAEGHRKDIEQLRAEQKELRAEQTALQKERAEFAVQQKLDAMGSRLTPAMRRGGESDTSTLTAALAELQTSGLELSAKAEDGTESKVPVAGVVLAALGAANPLKALEDGDLADAEATGDKKQKRTSAEAAIYAECDIDDKRMAELDRKYGITSGNEPN